MSLEVKDILKMAETQLADAGVENAKLDAELLYRFLFGLDKMAFFQEWSKRLDDENCERYLDLVAVRAGGKPLQYITGEQYFMGHRFEVDERVLIPRPETELLVEKLIEIGDKGSHVLDLCTGSGCIAISVALGGKSFKVTASDISDDAIELAKKNAKDLGADVKFVKGDLLQPFMKGLSKKKFDVIVSNPPYIPSAVIPTLQTEVKDHEPILALDGGEDGMDFYKKILETAKNCLKNDGMLMFEIGHDQGALMIALAADYGYDSCEIIKDLAGLDRIAIIK